MSPTSISAVSNNPEKGAMLLRDLFGKIRQQNKNRDCILSLSSCLAVDGRLGGHFVQGRVNCAAPSPIFQVTAFVFFS